MDSATEINTVAAEEQTLQEIKGKILQYKLMLKNKGRSPESIRTYADALGTLMNKGANILDPNNVEHIIAQQDKWSMRVKKNYVDWYARFAKFLHIEWEKPIYKAPHKIVNPPPEAMIDNIIANAPRKVSIAVHISKETAARLGEVVRIRWEDINVENSTIAINYPEKGSNAKVYSVPAGLIRRIMALPRINDNVLGKTSKDSISNMMLTTRKKLAFNFNDQRYMDLHFHVIRHWKLTNIAIESNSPYVVQEFGRHQDVKITMRYINLAQAIQNSKDTGNWDVRPVTSLQEAIELGKVGYTPYMMYEGVQLVRKAL